MYSEDYERARAQERNTEDVYSKPVRAGKRTYFFKEDFEKFAEGLEDAVAFIRARLGQVEPRGNAAEDAPGKSFTDVNFDEF